MTLDVKWSRDPSFSNTVMRVGDLIGHDQVQSSVIVRVGGIDVVRQARQRGYFCSREARVGGSIVLQHHEDVSRPPSDKCNVGIAVGIKVADGHVENLRRAFVVNQLLAESRGCVSVVLVPVDFASLESLR